jgi:hypothetical protein
MNAVDVGQIVGVAVLISAVNYKIHQIKVITTRKTKTFRAPRLTPEGLRPRNPLLGGRRVGNAGQHGKRVATREVESNCAPDRQQARVHQ